VFSQSQPLVGVIPPGTYYLVRLGTQNSNGPGALLPPANIEGDINLSGSNGKVALVRQEAPLFTDCSSSAALLVDLVGYGSASCAEGLTAPALNNTSAIFRKNGGLTDTNNNRNDFELAAASPRRTAPIAEFGPRVSGHEPDEPGAPRDGSVVLFFNEPVDVDVLADWYDITCATTGSHDLGAVASRFNNTRWIITPEANFLPGEQCTVTIRAAFVRDQDLDDAPGTDNLASDYTFTFDIATGAAPPHAASVHLTMGNPSGAATNLSTPNNYLMEKPEFTLSYNRDRGTANWVSWHLANEWQCCQPRPDDDPFRPDPALPDDWYLVLDEDYSSSGFDRGHVVPNADRNLSGSIPIQQATFLMTNMLPQSPDSNQGPWEKFERHLRDAFVNSGQELYVVAGGVGIGGTGNNGFATTIANGNVTVPAYSWKVALVIPAGSGDDISRVTGTTRTIAVVMPNIMGIRNDDWRPYLTSVDAVEQLTGYDFFANVPDAVENAIEAGVDGANPPGAAAQSVTTDEDVAKTFTLDAAAGGSATLTYTIVSATSQGTLSLSGGTATYTPAANFFGTDSFTWSVSDGSKSATATATIQVLSVNDLPVATVSAPALAQEGAPVTATVTASDIETASLTYSWTVTKNGTPFTSGAGAATFTFTPDAAGTWVVTATATDADGASATSSASITVVDPEGGFVTGGGFFEAATGRAIFNIGSKYLGDLPSGNTNLKAPGINFDSTSQAWLTIVGNTAQFAGEGTVNRAAGYAFVVTVEDGATDKVRFRIWEKATGTVVFDNGPQPQAIGGGSIQIHQ
jgi:endonuclease G